MENKKKSLTSKQKGYLGLAVMLLLAVVTIWGSGPIYKAISGIGRPKSDVPIYNQGTYQASTQGYGGQVQVTIKVSETEIQDVKIEGKDETPDIGGKAIQQLPNVIYSKQTDSFDSISGATITSNAVKTALKEAMIQAAREGTSMAQLGTEAESLSREESQMPELEQLLKNLPDGTYEYQDPEYDQSGYQNLVSVTVKDRRIKQLTWDCVDRDGNTKRQLSAEGNYDMTENGLKWYQQADQLQAYVIEQQSTEDMADESGYPALDAISSVSINISGFIHAVKRALMVQ